MRDLIVSMLPIFIMMWGLATLMAGPKDATKLVALIAAFVACFLAITWGVDTINASIG